MGRITGTKVKEKVENHDSVMDRARAEWKFSDRLYDLLFAYQERFRAVGNQPWATPLAETERVGDLNLPLSRLYHQIWSAVLGVQETGRPKKKANRR